MEESFFPLEANANVEIEIDGVCTEIVCSGMVY
jgi:hypothetical protein